MSKVMKKSPASMKASKSTPSKTSTETAKPVVASESVPMKSSAMKKNTNQSPKSDIKIPEKPKMKKTEEQSEHSISEDEATEDKEIEAAIVKNMPKNPNSMTLEKNRSKGIATAKQMAARGSLMVAHLPTGFCEPQIKEFFSQFGQLTRWRLSRSAKTGRSKNYAYVEYDLKEVAMITAKTIDKMLIWGKQLTCKYLETVPKSLYKNWNRKIHATERVTRAKNRQQVNNRVIKDDDGKQKLIVTKRQRGRAMKTASKINSLKDMGVQYEAPSAMKSAEVKSEKKGEKKKTEKEKANVTSTKESTEKTVEKSEKKKESVKVKKASKKVKTKKA